MGKRLLTSLTAKSMRMLKIDCALLVAPRNKSSLSLRKASGESVASAQ